MRQSELFTKTRKTSPKDEVAKNAQLLIKGGFISKEMAGVYNYLPLGLNVLKKIENIIRKEMNVIGGQEVLMSSLQRRELWETTKRWDFGEDDIWFKTNLKNAYETGLAFTHEEPITNMMEKFIPSYQDLPVYVYQFQNKFRNEERSKSGLLRTREFIMKDLYSFSRTDAEHDLFYEKVKDSYSKIFRSVGVKTYFTRASGGLFSPFSHEFQVVCETGEDTIYIHPELDIAVNEEIVNKPEAFEKLPQKSLFKEAKSIEVGNIFSLGNRFSESLLCKFKDKDGNLVAPIMGAYGIGLGRLMATVVETLSDDKGIIWPESIAPFRVHLIELSRGLGEDLYKKLQKKGIDVLYDERDSSAGEKFNDADLIGIPWRFVVSEKTKGKVEIKRRDEDKVEITSYDKAIRKLL